MSRLLAMSIDSTGCTGPASVPILVEMAAVTTTKTVHAKTKTVHSKTTKTKTETKCPGAKKTITSTVYATKTTTIKTRVTTTTTSTATSVVASTTVYGACLSAANYAERVFATPIVELRPLDEERMDGIFEVQDGIDDAFSCCNAAFITRPASEGGILEAPEIWALDSAPDENNPDVLVPRCFFLGSVDACTAPTRR
ncbi:hypothetical protein BST61_g7619 [Cercospora zeina]